jgi:hypothetical protein
MNERIKELAEQAGLTWRVQPLHYTNTNNPIDFPVGANRDLEKFAELIIKECAAEADKQTIYCRGIPWGRWLKEHFGVKE